MESAIVCIESVMPGPNRRSVSRMLNTRLSRRASHSLVLGSAAAACLLVGDPVLGNVKAGGFPTPPPRATLQAVGSADDQYTLKRGSYCSVDGCVDTRFPRPRRVFDVCGGSRVLLRVHTKARRVKVERLTDSGPSVYAPTSKLRGSKGRRWRFRVPGDSPARVALLVTIKYTLSTPYRDAGFGGRLAIDCPAN
jgi:hypothetical protein